VSEETEPHSRAESQLQSRSDESV